MTKDSQEQTPTPGTITSIERQQKNQHRISIFIDHTFAFGAHQDVLFQHNLYTGRILDAPTIQAILHSDQLIRAKMAAIAFLSHRSRTEHEVREKLHRAHFDDQVIDIVITRLHEISYLDDETFVRNYIKDRLNRKGYGPIRLKADLRRLGISAGNVDEAIQTLTNRDDIFKKALEEAKKRIRKTRERNRSSKKTAQALWLSVEKRAHT